MGTRADFYVGKGKNAEWLGSVAFDGDQWSRSDSPLLTATTVQEFRDIVDQIAQDQLLVEDWITPSRGDAWPWPWPTSQQTDYVYYWDYDNAVAAVDRTYDDVWPNMLDVNNHTTQHPPALPAQFASLSSPTISEYDIIVEWHILAFKQRVQTAIKNGWTLYGDTTVSQSSAGNDALIFIQPMVKYE